MRKIRLYFSKTGNAKYISHLDLARLFGRAFARIGIPVRYSEGYNPHMRLVFGPPLSLGYEGTKEILDFETEEEIGCDEIVGMFNKSLPSGISVNSACEPKTSIGDVAYAAYKIEMTTEDMDEKTVRSLNSLFCGGPIEVLKKSKSGEKITDIAPMVDSIIFELSGDGKKITVDAVLACSNSSNLNPEYIKSAAAKYLSIDFSGFECVRTNFLNAEKKPLN